MALPPKFAGHKMALSDSPVATPHTIEIYLDYACPFSAKMFKTLYTTVIPHSRSTSYAKHTVFIFRQLIQPWHPSSTLVHESALAVLQLTSSSSEKFWSYSSALFAHQTEYFDVSVVNEGRNETYKRLAALAEDSVGVKKEEVMRLLKVEDKPGEDGELNKGNGVTADVKTVTKMARRVGAHVTPTVFLDGVEVGEISSSWDEGKWKEWLEKNCA